MKYSKGGFMKPKNKLVERLNKMVVGDVIKTKKYKITCKDSVACAGCCFKKTLCRDIDTYILCSFSNTADGESHLFIREKILEKDNLTKLLDVIEETISNSPALVDFQTGITLGVMEIHLGGIDDISAKRCKDLQNRILGMVK